MTSPTPERTPGKPSRTLPRFERVPASDECLIVAPARWDRPLEAWEVSPDTAAAREDCPFCAGREAETPPAVAEYLREGSAAAWDVRVVPNQYPVTCDSTSDHGKDSEHRVVQGVHEVIVEAPGHVTEWGALEPSQTALVIKAWCDRLQSVSQSYRFASLFKNNGHRAGASLSHIHSQLIALDLVPPAVVRRETWWDDFHRRHGACWLCAGESHGAGGRLIDVAADGEMRVVVPRFAAMAGETWVYPSRHACHFHSMEAGERAALARKLLESLGALQSVLGPFAYNLVVQTPSFGVPEAAHHWYVRIIPRIVVLGGFEWATQCYINPLDPERLAAELRSATGGRSA